jgi:xylan 1,4-beta-xylosidase
MKANAPTRYAIRKLHPKVFRSARTAHTLAALLGLVGLIEGRPAHAATVTVDASKQTAGNPRFWSAAVGVGTASLTLRSDLQTHYKIGNRELGMQRVRGHGLLNDDMGIYKSSGTYDFSKLDTYLTAITSAGMRPFMELDFMPTALASGDMHTPPKDYNAWKALIKAVAQHCVDKYGADDVAKWYWEVWNEPDYSGFWKGTDMPAYYTLYDNTVDALTAVIPNVIVGGPVTTEPSKIGAFLQHCKSGSKRVSFVSSHVYPGGDGTKTSSTSADAADLVSDNNTRVSQISSGGYTTATVKSFNTEWNSSYSGQGGNPADVVKSMDNHWNVGFILKGIKLLSDKNSSDTPALDVFSYWSLSDIFDESSGPSGSYILGKNGTLPFGQVFGMMTFQGVRKAAFNAFKMLNYLGPKRLQSTGGAGGDGVDAMATKSANDDEVQILVYNYYKTLNTTGSDSVTVNVSNLPTALAGKEIFVTQFLVDETHSNPYSVWAKQTSPTAPTESQWQEMKSAQHLALAQPVSKKTVDTSFTTTFTLSRQAGTLIILGTKRPVTGRNSLVELEGEDYDGQSGVTKEDSGDTDLGQSIALASAGYAYFENVDYTDAGVGSLQLRVKSQSDTTLELHQASQTGTLLGKCAVTSTSNAWATQTCALSQAVSGVSRLYVVASGAVHLNWLKFQAGDSPPPGTGGAGGGGTSGGGGATGSSSGGTTGTSKGGATGSSSGGTTGTSKGGATGSASGGSTGSASGGAAGNGSGGVAGSGNGGATGNGSGGSTGSANGGSQSGGSVAGASGKGGGAGGNDGSGGTSPGDGKTSSGCSCNLGSRGGTSATLLTVGLAGLVLGLRRKKFRRISSSP